MSNQQQKPYHKDMSIRHIKSVEQFTTYRIPQKKYKEFKTHNDKNSE